MKTNEKENTNHSIKVKNKYLLLLIQELVDKLRKAKYFTKLNVHWGFNNVRIKEGDEWKVGFGRTEVCSNCWLCSSV